MTARELGFWDRLEREACVLEAYALTPFYLTEYLRAETGYEMAGLSGLLPGLIEGLKVLAATTVAGAAAGAAAGTPFFGVGMVPGAIFGAEAGLDAGLYLLFLAGLPALAEYVAANIGKIVELFQRGTGIAWNAPDSPLAQAEVERAARCFAQGVAVWVRIVLEAAVLYLIGKGGAGAARRLAREMRGAGYGALADTVEAEGTSLVGNPKLQPKLAGAGESGGGGELAQESGHSRSDSVPSTRRARLKTEEAKSGSLDEPPEPSKESNLVKDLKTFEVDGLKAAQIRPGAGNGIAVIGRSMTDVRRYAGALGQKGYNVEIFDGDNISPAAVEEWEAKIKSLPPGVRLTPSELAQTQLFKENQAWAEGLAKGNGTIVDIDNPSNLSESAFYSMEQKVIFGKTSP
jgi:hypothetical protein